jgi:glycosyltransferase involved in cell wall biosynthesis
MLTALLRHREAAGLDVRVWFGQDGPYREEVAAMGVPVTIAGGVRSAIPAVRRLVVRDRPDLLVSWLPRAHLVTGPVAAATGLRTRSVCFQHIVPEGNWRHVVGFSLPTAAVIATSAASAAGQRRLRPRRPVGVVRPGIDPPRPPDPAERQALRASLGLEAARPTIGILGRLVRWKGSERLLDAVRALRAEGRDLRLLVVGGEDPNEADGTEARLRARIAAEGLDDVVILTGQVPDALPYLELCDVLVSASDPEPFGIVLLEAMALGVPVVAVARGGPLEVLEDGVTATLVPSGAPEDLAAGVRAVLDDPAAAAARCDAARQVFRERFTAEQMARRAAAALQAVADGTFEDGCGS